MVRFALVLSFVLVSGCAKKEAPASTPAASKNAALVTLKGIDLTGGDIKRFKTKNGLDECMKTCAENKKCNAFTFANAKHKNAKVKNVCWLKKTGFKYTRNGQFTSGIKP